MALLTQQSKQKVLEQLAVYKPRAPLQPYFGSI